MGKKQDEERSALMCPVGRFFMDLDKMAGKKSKFFDHLSRSRIEFLKAVRSLVDERIQTLEKKSPHDSHGKMKKIVVE